MVYKYPCPKCGSSNAIRYGKTKLAGQLRQRIRCLSCKKTSSLPYRLPFFNGMRTSEDKIHEAIKLYIAMEPFRTIARKLETRPNTVINWVNRVYDRPLQYKAYIKRVKGFSEKRITRFFSDIRNATKKRVTRYDKKMLIKKLDDIFCYIKEQDAEKSKQYFYAIDHPVSAGRYKKKRLRDYDFSEP